MRHSHLEIVTTADGSHTIQDTELDVTYHSMHGALTESTHVFIDHGLDVLAQNRQHAIEILEIGFGTGLNALLAFEYAEQYAVSIDYTSLEPFPLPPAISVNLNYPDLIAIPGIRDTFDKMHTQLPEIRTSHGNQFTLRIECTPLEAYHTRSQFDLIFYDAFGPASAPELWSSSSLAHLKRMLHRGSVLVTFCAQGQFKRNLKSLGFVVESLPGPPGKREMVRATLE